LSRKSPGKTAVHTKKSSEGIVPSNITLVSEVHPTKASCPILVTLEGIVMLVLVKSSDFPMQIDKAYLFGSYAKGCSQEDNDIYIALLSATLNRD